MANNNTKSNDIANNILSGAHPTKAITKETLEQMKASLTIEQLHKALENLATAFVDMQKENDMLRSTLNHATMTMFAAAKSYGGELRIDKCWFPLSNDPNAKLDRYECLEKDQIVLTARITTKEEKNNE